MRAYILGAASLPLNHPTPASPLELISRAATAALRDAGISLHDVTGLLASPSLAPGLSFMPAHQLASHMGLLPDKRPGSGAAGAAHHAGVHVSSINTCGASPVSGAQSTSGPSPGPCRRAVCVSTLDVGGASPISALALARRMVQHEGHSVVIVAAADAVASLSRSEFLALADSAFQVPGASSVALPSPVIPNAYDTVARWHMAAHPQLTRRHLAMCASLMTLQASRHPNALTKRALTVEQVLASPQVAPNTTVLECAKRADGAAAVVVVSEAFIQQLQQQHQHQHQQHQHQHQQPCSQSSGQASNLLLVEVLGTGEASGPYLPPPIHDMDDSTFASCRQAVCLAAVEAGLDPGRLASQIDYFGLYDCFPICLVRAIEAVGLAKKGEGGLFIEQQYSRLLPHFADGSSGKEGSAVVGQQGACLMNINSHGGLMGQGAPWEAPAMYSLVEAVLQLRGQAHGRQVPGARTALVYGNGGILSASAVAILRRQEPQAENAAGTMSSKL